MKRRTVLAALPALLARPSIGRAQAASTLRFIPQIDLSIVDPHITTAYVTRTHGYAVFDTLYGQDGAFAATPQMVEGHTVENDGLLWRLQLRDGLRWHDGEPVLARDCVASIKRWARRDPFGDALMDATNDLSAPDDRTIQFRLKRPFPLLPAALGKSPPPMCAMMPERLASTDPFKPIPEIVGSGPYRFKADERVAGARAVYSRFEGYKPRQSGAPEWTSGPKVAHFERIEWTTIPDGATAAAALQNGEQDWWEYAAHDLLPLLRRTAGTRVAVPDTTGAIELMRPNHLQPPFDNPAIRRAILGAVSQADFMQAIVGNDPTMYHVPAGNFCPGTPMASEVALEPFKGERDYARVKEQLKAAGYNGERVVLMAPSDYVFVKAMGDVAADMFHRIGMNVDYVLTDFGTMLQRRAKKEPVEQGGWSMFVSGFGGIEQLNPVGHIALRGNGDQPGAWPGWPVSPELERLRTAWLAAPDVAAQRSICLDMQRQAMTDVPYIPVGQYIQPTAYRADLTGVLGGFATFWNLARA